MRAVAAGGRLIDTVRAIEHSSRYNPTFEQVEGGAMSGNGDSKFFDELTVLDEFAGVTDFNSYRPLPLDWVLAVADVVDSTKAITEGRYKAVNTAGASVITALLNGLGSYKHPFVFGGDGAMMALPGSRQEEAVANLSALVVWVGEALNLEMRAAIVPMADVRNAGYDVQVLRYRASVNAVYSMFVGGGSSWAEDQMKRGRYSVPAAKSGSRPDLTGLSCRWDPIPASHGEILSLIIAPGGDGLGPRFKSLLTDILQIVSQQARDGHPLPPNGPPLTLTTKGIDTEARATASEGRFLARKLGIFAETMLAVGIDFLGLPIGSFDPKRYKVEVAENSDFRKFDDGLKMTVDLSAVQSNQIEDLLVKAAASGVCRFGIHRQLEALMTCFVPSLDARDHIHFVDGAGGGYALAASMMKADFPQATPPDELP